MWTYIVGPNKKVIVFDLNGTITGRVSDHPAHIEYRDHYIRKHTEIKNLDFLPNETSEALKACGLSPIKYYVDRNNSLDWNVFHEFKDAVYGSLLKLKEVGFTLVLYTDCHEIQVQKTLAILRIKSLLDLIIAEEYNMKKPSPKAFHFIADRFNCSPSEMVMVGNNYVKDLLPLILMGGSGIKIESEDELESAISEVLSVSKRKAS